MKSAAASILIGFTILLPPIPADALDGADLYRSCQSKNKDAADVACLSYVRGFVEGMMLGSRLGDSRYCPPKESVSPTQGRLLVEKYLRDHPERLHIESAFLVAEALMTAFSCHKGWTPPPLDSFAK